MDQEQMVSAVLQAVQALPQSRQPLIVALDGRCASGKTTLAALLQQQTGRRGAVHAAAHGNGHLCAHAASPSLEHWVT